MMSDMRSMNDDVSRQVAAKLVERQGGRTDAEMAALLGCGRVYYWQIKRGVRRISYEMAKRAAQDFPEILPIILRDLTGEPTAVIS